MKTTYNYDDLFNKLEERETRQHQKMFYEMVRNETPLSVERVLINGVWELLI